MARNYYTLPRKQIKILDFCCGAGNNTWCLAREGFDTFAFDGSKSAVEKVNDRLRNEGLRANVIVSDAGCLEYKDSFFDCIVDSCGIQNNVFSDINLMYKKCHAMLKEGGRIISTAFSVKTTGYGTGEKIEEDTYRNVAIGPLHHDTGTINHFWTENSLREILKDSGFISVNIDTVTRTDGKALIDLIVATAFKGI